MGAQVRSAQSLTEDQQAALSKKVQAMAGTNKVDIDLSVDPSLIGGFVVSLGSQGIVASVWRSPKRADPTPSFTAPSSPTPRWDHTPWFPSVPTRSAPSSNNRLRTTTSRFPSATSAPC